MIDFGRFAAMRDDAVIFFAVCDKKSILILHHSRKNSQFDEI